MPCRRALNPQKGKLLERVELLIRQQAEAKTAEEKRAQEKIRRLGRCPMDYEWLRQEGGYRCAGGSHWLSDADLAD